MNEDIKKLGNYLAKKIDEAKEEIIESVDTIKEVAEEEVQGGDEFGEEIDTGGEEDLDKEMEDIPPPPPKKAGRPKSGVIKRPSIQVTG